MRALVVITVLCAAIVAQGCKSRKRQPVPGPQVQAAHMEQACERQILRRMDG
jgi:hypothetical protein